MTDHHLTLTCPECHEPTLACAVVGQGRTLEVTLLAQDCECDPYHAWEDVWEEARERVYEEESYD